MAAKSARKQAQTPLILQCSRLMEAFAKSNDERDYYLDTQEGFLLYADLDKSEEALDALELEIARSGDRFLMIPKMTFYETKKLMENFVNEKVYDIDTKEKLMDIIQSRGPREHFLEFIYDHHVELEKWQQYYQERSRIRIIEWLRQFELVFVFEEDLDLTRNLVEGLKRTLFDSKVPKEIAAARKLLDQKAKVYYSNEALNPRPKRGRPPKQQQKVEIEPQATCDIYTTVPTTIQTFLFTPDVSTFSMVSFSVKYDNEEEFLASMRGQAKTPQDAQLDSLNQKLEALRRLSGGAFESDATNEVEVEDRDSTAVPLKEFSRVSEEEDILDLIDLPTLPKKAPIPKEAIGKKKVAKKESEEAPEPKKKAAAKKVPVKKAAVKKAPAKKAPAKKAPAKKAPAKKAPAKKAPAKKATAKKTAAKKK